MNRKLSLLLLLAAVMLFSTGSYNPNAGTTFPLRSPNSATTCCTGTPQYSFTADTTTGMYYISTVQGPGGNPGLGFTVGGTLQGGFFGGDFWATSLRGYSGSSTQSQIDIQADWIFDTGSATGAFWPATDNVFNIGKPTLRPQRIYVSDSINTGTASNTNQAGQLTLSGGTVTFTFSTPGTANPPICTASSTASVPVEARVTTSAGPPATLTLTVPGGTNTDTYNYICVFRN